MLEASFTTPEPLITEAWSLQKGFFHFKTVLKDLTPLING
jgi:hypothetical protein